jgi:hypothetical protein
MYTADLEVDADGARLLTYQGLGRAAARQRARARQARRGGVPVPEPRVFRLQFEVSYAGIPAHAAPPTGRDENLAFPVRIDQPFPPPADPAWRPEADGLSAAIEQYGTTVWSGSLPAARLSGATVRVLAPDLPEVHGRSFSLPLDGLPTDRMLRAWSDTMEAPASLLIALPPEVLRG